MTLLLQSIMVRGEATLYNWARRVGSQSQVSYGRTLSRWVVEAGFEPGFVWCQSPWAHRPPAHPQQYSQEAFRQGEVSL